MGPPVIKYTTNKAVDHFNVGATLMKITGYVDCIEGLRELPKSPSKWIYKCILNNTGGRRVRIIFWGDDALKYNKEIEMYQIIKIINGVIKDSNPTYRRSGDTVNSKEFQFGRGSQLEVLGKFDPSNGAAGSSNPNKEVTFKPIEMEDVCNARESVVITGWLKEPFRSVSTSNGASYGCGMMCTAVHRMTINIPTFVQRDDILEGMKIEVKGTIDRRGDAFVLNASTMNHIVSFPDAPRMTEDEMDDAVEPPPLTPKRVAEDSVERDNEKKYKVD